MSRNTRNIPRLEKELDSVFSLFIRLRGSWEICGERVNTCYTCGKMFPVKLLDCGHYHSRSVMSLRYDERNGRPQCQNCNRYLSGNRAVYEANLLKDHGQEWLDELNRDKNILKTESDFDWYIKNIRFYRDKLSNMW